MKTSITKLKSSFILSLTLATSVAWAKPVAQVIDVKGQVFVISPDGKTKTVKANDHLEEKSEVMVGEEGNITLNDYYDATYHMIEGSHIKFFNKSVQLKKGKTWIQSLNSRHPLALTTANGEVNFWKGEFITTFEQASAKTQVLVVNGEVEVSNVLDKNMKYSVPAGSFTLIDPEVESGLPRTPTRVGLNSLNTALAEFKALPEKLKEAPTEKATAPERKIASVEETPAVKKGQIIFMTNGKRMDRVPASVTGAHEYFKKKVATKKWELTPAPIRFYGVAPVAASVTSVSKQEVAPRNPASIKPLELLAVPKKVGSDLNIDAEFSESLRIEKASQPKHSKELENLIQDLKSY